MIDNSLIGFEVSQAHLNWCHLSMNSRSIDLEELFRVYMDKQPDLRGISIEKTENLIQEIMHLIQPTSHSMTGKELMEKQYKEGKLLNLPGQQRISKEEQAELERLAQVFATGKPLSEIIIEDRGSR